MSLEPACSLFCPPVPPDLSPLSHLNQILSSIPHERVTVGSSPRIGGGDELLAAHTELTYWRGCKIHGGDEVGWVVGRTRARCYEILCR